MPYEKHYTGIRSNLQVFQRNKIDGNIYTESNKTLSVDSDSSIYVRVQRKNSKFREIQPVPQNNSGAFSERGQMDRQQTGKPDKKDSIGKDIQRSHNNGETDILHSGRYHIIENEAFVTGSLPDRRCVFPPVAPEKTAGLRTSDCISHALVQRNRVKLCQYHV